jgi:hypothetical protein
MKFSELPPKDKVAVSCVMFFLWSIATAIGCTIGLVLFKGW